MPEIPIYTAPNLERPPRVRTDISQVADPKFAAASQFGNVISNVAQKTFEHFLKIKALRDETDVVDLQSKWDAGVKDIHAELKTDPDVIAKPENYIIEFNKRAQKLRGDIARTASNQNVAVGFQNYVDRKLGLEYVNAKAEGLQLGVINEVARLEEARNTLAELAARAPSPEARIEIQDRYYGLVEKARATGHINEIDAVKRNQDFKVHSETTFMTRIGRENPSAMLELDDAGAFDNVPTLARSSLVAQAQNAIIRQEDRQRRESERRDKAVHDDISLQVGNLIASGKRNDARDTVEFYAQHRMIPAALATNLRELYNAPVADRFSDPAIAQRVLLDVESINPRTTEGEIDNLVARGARGEPGLSLADGIKAKNQLRATRTALQNRTTDQALATNLREHNQAEQELRAALGIREGIVASALQDDPNGRVYGQLLPELRKRSVAFGGTEKPLDVVDSMRDRISKALGAPAALKPSEIQALYPDWQSLEKARREHRITEEAFQTQVRLRSGAPTVAPPRAAPPKRKRYGE